MKTPEAHFLTPLKIEQMGPDLWRLLADLVYWSRCLRVSITAPKGFITDLESVPRWIPVAYAVLYGSAHAAGTVHDFLYQTRKIVYRTIARAEADGVLYEAAGAPGPGIEPTAGWKRQLIWSGVRLGGRRAWRTGPERLQILWDRRRTPRVSDPAEQGI